MRPSFEEFYLGIAQAASLRGECTRSKVGAVIVLRLSNYHLTSIGYNGVGFGEKSCLQGECPRGRFTYKELPSNPMDYSSGGLKCIATHAEVNAFYNARFDVEFSELYCTRKPCVDCFGFLSSEGVAEFYWPGGTLSAKDQWS